MALIFYMSSRPAPDEIRCIPIIAKLKIVHIIEYGILYLLAWFAIIKTTAYNELEAFALAFMITVFYGLTDEFHQIFIVGRTASFMDVAADGVGGILAKAGVTISGHFRQ
jgi:VanZ family protein